MAQGSANRPDRTRFHTVGELIDELAEAAKLRGLAKCRHVEFLKTLPDDGSFEAATRAIVALQTHPEFGPELCCESILWAGWAHTDEEAAQIQHDNAWALVRHPWSATRGVLETLLRERRLRFHSANALELILDYLKANHPNAKGFVMRPHIARHIPADIDLTDWPCPPDLAGVEARGLAPRWPAHRED